MDLRLVQISDVHLGRSFSGLDLPEEIRAELAEAALASVRRAVELAHECDAVALLVAGDLFDRSDVEPDLYEQVRAAFAAADVPVLVSPGNHDAFGPTSVWNRRALERLGFPPWPAHVHVFETRTLSPRVLLDGALTVYGHRVEGYHGREDSPLAELSLPSGPGRRVLLIHGALALGIHDHRTTMPFTVEELAAIGADYVAVGHYHGFRLLEHGGRLVGAYAGTPVPGGVAEDPHGGVLVVRVGDADATVECVETYPGRIRRLRVDGIPPLESDEDAVGRLRVQAEREAVTSSDLVLAELDGFSRVVLDTAALEDTLRNRFRAIRIRDETEPEGDPADTAGSLRATVESQFRRRLEERLAGSDDPEERERLAAALRHGLAALRGRPVRPAGTGGAVDAS